MNHFVELTEYHKFANLILTRMLNFITPYLPQAPGYLPLWQLFVSSLAIFNSIQNFTTLKLTRRVYNGVPPATVTALHARTFGIWTLTAAFIRLYAAYHISNKQLYDLAIISYFIAFGHFFSEVFIFRSAKVGAGVLGPAIVSTSSLIWMFKQYDFYVKS